MSFSAIELVLLADEVGDAHRAPLTAEIERRGIDVAAVRRRIRALMAELRRLPEEDLKWMQITADAEGLYLLANAVLKGEDPLASARA